MIKQIYLEKIWNFTFEVFSKNCYKFNETSIFIRGQEKARTLSREPRNSRNRPNNIQTHQMPLDVPYLGNRSISPAGNWITDPREISFPNNFPTAHFPRRWTHDFSRYTMPETPEQFPFLHALPAKSSHFLHHVQRRFCATRQNERCIGEERLDIWIPAIESRLIDASPRWLIQPSKTEHRRTTTRTPSPLPLPLCLSHSLLFFVSYPRSLASFLSENTRKKNTTWWRPIFCARRIKVRSLVAAVLDLLRLSRRAFHWEAAP